MSRMRNFVAGAGTIAAIQEHILDSLDYTFPDEQDRAAIEAAILSSGFSGWESRAINILKSNVEESHKSLDRHIAALKARYRQVVPHPGQDDEAPAASPMGNPHLRVYFCLKCGYRVTSLAMSGICCHGQPECPRCHHVVHEASCKKEKKHDRAK